MRTVRCSGHLGGRGVCPGGGCLGRGLPRGGVCPERGVCLGGCTPPPHGQTDICENNLSASTVADGNKKQVALRTCLYCASVSMPLVILL